ncbi:Ig-like domain-containing protein [Tepidiforma sp.]|uniref:Ig-like domain-containing protein n=1 Tax=Tepidiforma sp. TaxID=2682230 RepID=UPI00262F0BA6|nr:Ig-like domain-containing protein [Tepidiforma sp.]MCX7619089.1 Ig-like domain-containing protein [Tepidiforma sp.]
MDVSSVSLKINGAEAAGAAAGPSGVSWTPPRDLADGHFAVSLSVKDVAGNEISAAWGFDVDATPPLISGLSPASGSVVRVQPVFSGRVEGANAVRFFLDSAEIPGVFVAGDGSFEWEAAGLENGPHTFRVEASDLAGNSASASTTVTVRASPPAPPEILSVVSTPIRRMFVKLRCAPGDAGFVRPSAEFLKGGGEEEPAPGWRVLSVRTSGDVFTLEIAPGESDSALLRVRLADDAGLFSAAVARAVEYTPGSIPGEATISIVSPLPEAGRDYVLVGGPGMTEKKISVAVYATGAGPLSITCSGVSVEPPPAAAGLHTLTGVPLVEGDQTLRVSLTDAAGGSEYAELKVVCDTTPPVVRIVSPTKTFPLSDRLLARERNRPLPLKGEVSDRLGVSLKMTRAADEVLVGWYGGSATYIYSAPEPRPRPDLWDELFVSEPAPDYREYPEHERPAPEVPDPDPDDPMAARTFEGALDVGSGLEGLESVTVEEARWGKGNGVFRFEVAARDELGNESEPVVVMVELDTVAPRVRPAANGLGGLDVWPPRALDVLDGDMARLEAAGRRARLGGRGIEPGLLWVLEGARAGAAAPPLSPPLAYSAEDLAGNVRTESDSPWDIRGRAYRIEGCPTTAWKRGLHVVCRQIC